MISLRLLASALLFLLLPYAAMATSAVACTAAGEGDGFSRIMYGYDVMDGRTIDIFVVESCGEESFHGTTVYWREPHGGPYTRATWWSEDGDTRSGEFSGMHYSGDLYVWWSWHGSSSASPGACSFAAYAEPEPSSSTDREHVYVSEPCPTGLLPPPSPPVPWRMLAPLEDEHGNIKIPLP